MCKTPGRGVSYKTVLDRGPLMIRVPCCSRTTRCRNPVACTIEDCRNLVVGVRARANLYKSHYATTCLSSHSVEKL